MPWSVSGSGEWSKSSVSGNPSIGFGQYFFFSGEITTTDNFADSQQSFGFICGELTIVNLGSQPLAYQYPPQFGTNIAAGVVPANDHITIRNAKHFGIAVRSLTSGQQTTCSIQAV